MTLDQIITGLAYDLADDRRDVVEVACFLREQLIGPMLQWLRSDTENKDPICGDNHVARTVANALERGDPWNCPECEGHGFYMTNAHGPQEIICKKCKGTGVR